MCEGRARARPPTPSVIAIRFESRESSLCEESRFAGSSTFMPYEVLGTFHTARRVRPRTGSRIIAR